MARVPNPYGYTDPAMASIAGNIAQIFLGGESPNQKALREAELALRGAQTEAAQAQAGKYGAETALTQQAVDARTQDEVLRRIAIANGIDPNAVDVGSLLFGDTPESQRLRDDYRTYGFMDMYGPGTQRAGDVANAAFTNRSAGELLLGDTIGVAQRQAAMAGEPVYDVKNNTLFDRFTGESQQTEHGALVAGRDTRAPVKVNQGGKPVYMSPAEALGMEAYEAPRADRQPTWTDVKNMDQLIFNDLGVAAEDLDPSVMPVLRAAVEAYVSQGVPHAEAIRRAIAENPIVDTQPWYRSALYGFAEHPQIPAAAAAPMHAEAPPAPAAPVATSAPRKPVPKLPQSQWDAAIEEANKAIQRGADPEKVKQRLRDMGIPLKEGV